jgi:CBS-domain-containing membrane protein
MNWKSAIIAFAIVQAAILMVFALDVPMILTSWASSAALIGGLRSSPAARPLAVSGGHIISGLVGIGALVIAKQGFPFDPRWLIAPGVGLAVPLMTATRLLHPPCCGESCDNAGRADRAGQLCHRPFCRCSAARRADIRA